MASATATRSSAIVATATLPASPTPRATPFPVASGGLAGKHVVVDPGHGGRDPGAVYHGLHEADVNLAVALELRSLLEAAGATVTMTRSTASGGGGVGNNSTTDRDLQARVDIANRAAADLFLSIHGNAHTDREVQGALTFFGPERGFASGATRSPRLVGRSAQFAAAMQRELVVATAGRDRGSGGVRQANFWVLGGPRMPAILVEIGFLTNSYEAALLGNATYQRHVAQGIVAGVARFFATEDDAQFVADITLSDGALVPPGSQVTKTWRLRNTGVTTWGPGYQLAFHSGDALGAPASVPLPSLVPPGAEVDIDVPLKAPSEASSVVEGRWQLRSPAGISFGDRVWVSLQARTSLPTDAAPRIAHPELRYFDATGHNVGFAFRRFFEQMGGLDIFGYPRTEEFVENGWTVQYFQRARFEYHPEHAGTPHEVQLTLLGDLLTAGRTFPTTGVISAFPEEASHRYFPETGHGVHFAFLRYFRERGGLALFGYPITEEFVENGRTVQYFQRARVEYHPEHAGTPYEVELGLLGDEWLTRAGWLR